MGHTTQIERLRSRAIERSTGKLQISPGQTFDFTADDMKDLGEIGRGNYGTVNKMLHKMTNTVMAVKPYHSGSDLWLRPASSTMLNFRCGATSVVLDFKWLVRGAITTWNFPVVLFLLCQKWLPSESKRVFKRIRSTVEEREQKQLLMDLDVVMRSNNCPYIVQFYGALFKEGDCWICMELMDTSLDKFYKFVYGHLQSSIPENILGKITVATLKALNYLKEHLKIIHRDVKPSNILLDRKGAIKLCDFGISGHLVDSIAKSRDAGCRPYMAPERIDPRASSHGYDVRSDVWSLGITLMELATGRFPYPKWKSVFDQLQQVVQGCAPRLPHDKTFSDEFVNFINKCLTKDEKQRPKYNKLLDDPFIKLSEELEVDVASYVCCIHDQMKDCVSLTPTETSLS
ncbi:dual specificity mitogen-activated protein kinase kinase 4-like isoform X2 [Pomacea canaliculata]|nr:dual specificity mitogen-activated protein kinase kinase 4-like isoform X2 [Pomacea canaliculata]XP_025086543.1 dual specificity mitogen-activated protein kinase kinase 4-like isoform X2 [Pomacea canaliculata]XP_025086544.1 dual specificity mitogen-activated protein kinase kinase 4-like isoform X2 [Pomacea canaliculata]